MTPLQFDPAREERELREYLGEAFDERAFRNHEAAVEGEFHDVADESRFYRVARGYLYDLTVFAMSETKRPYLERLIELVEPRGRLLDYGCGIGADGLLLLEAGYRVEFADFANPSTEYLRWRLRRRGLEAPVHDLDEHVPGGFDAAYSFDVIEHVPDPAAFLAELERRSALVMVNLLEPSPGEIDLHRDLPVRRLVGHAASRRLRAYEIHHGRSHLIAYEPERAAPIARAAALLRVAVRRLAHRLRGGTA